MIAFGNLVLCLLAQMHIDVLLGSEQASNSTVSSCSQHLTAIDPKAAPVTHIALRA